MENLYHKTKPFTCYFCNELIEKETQQGHISTCSSVLEPCANKCGSYIPRNMRNQHLKECKNKKWKSMVKLPPPGYDPYENPTGSLRLHNRTSQQYSMVPQYQPPIDFTNIIARLQNLDEVYKQLANSLNGIKMKQQDDILTLRTAHIQGKMEFEKSQYQNQALFDWRNKMDLQMEAFKQDCKNFEKIKNDIGSQLVNIQTKLGGLRQLEGDLKEQVAAFLQDQAENRETHTELFSKLNEFKDFYVQENALIGTLWHDHKMQIENLMREIDILQKIFDEQRSKFSGLVFDVRTVSQISSETSEKLEIQERRLVDLRKDLSQLRLDVGGIEDLISNSSYKFGAVCSKSGRMVWRVAEFALKMDNAKENDCMIKSPIFYTHDFGYKIRLEVYLNGIKKWKGRHMIACLHVLKGEFDALLKWPCHIEGVFILRDLQDPENPKDFSKFLTAKRHFGDEENEEPQESSTQYIFVPHTTLTKNAHLKDDTVYMEVRINKKSSSAVKHETEL